MSDLTDLSFLFSIVISLLLTLVVYFIRLLHVDFRRMQKDLTEVKATTSLIKSEFKGGLELIGQRVAQLEARVRQLESIFFNMKSNEHE